MFLATPTPWAKGSVAFLLNQFHLYFNKNFEMELKEMLKFVKKQGLMILMPYKNYLSIQIILLQYNKSG